MLIDRTIESLRTAPRSALRLAFGLLAAALLFAAPALSVGQIVAFDHLTTGWPLTGMHENVRCETCHIKGIFKGTPRTCSICHSQNDSSRGAKAMPLSHIVTTQTCDTCHSTSTFLGVLFSHVTVVPGTCNTCHDNIHSIGKPNGHVPTTASCDACHKTSAFVPIVTFDHAQWLASPDKGGWTCTNCHDGRFALGKPSNHIPSPAATTCETCHFAPNTNPGFTSFAGGEMDHVSITANCGQCHAPAVANSFVGVQIRSSTGLMPPHVPTTVTTCETCHQAPPPAMPIPVAGAASIGGTTFAGGQMSHAGITNNCATCHGVNVMAGTFYGVVPKTPNGLSPQHMPTTAACEGCHTNAIPSMLIPGSGATT